MKTGVETSVTCLSEKAGQGYYYEDRLLIHEEQRAFETRGAISVERALEEAAAKNRPFRMKGFWGEGRRKGWGTGRYDWSLCPWLLPAPSHDLLPPCLREDTPTKT